GGRTQRAARRARRGRRDGARGAEPAVGDLVEAGVLYPDTVGGDEGYSFTHALLRDAAYDSLLRDDRQMLHLRVARALQRRDPSVAVQQPELLALHLTEAGQAEEAASLW